MCDNFCNFLSQIIRVRGVDDDDGSLKSLLKR